MKVEKIHSVTLIGRWLCEMVYSPSLVTILTGKTFTIIQNYLQ